MEIEIIVAVLSLLGVALGAFMSGLGYYLKIRSERKRNVNNVLYHMLEIRHFLRSSCLVPEKIQAEYYEYCSDYFDRKGLASGEGLPTELADLIITHFSEIIGAVRPELNAKFAEEFGAAVAALSVDHPVLAYKLRGREKLDRIVAHQQSYVGELEQILESKVPEELHKFLTSLCMSTSDKAMQELIDDIDRDILRVSTRCGILSYIGIKRELSRDVRKEKMFDPEALDPIMDGLIDSVIKNNGNKQDSYV